MARTTDMVFALYGHDKTASKTLKGVGKEADSVGDSFKKMGKVAATSFLAVGTAAVAFAASATKAAIEDQKSQKMLAASLKNTTHATDAQVKSTEDFITKMQLTYGIADDKLRPAFATLTRATGDLGESQKLTQVAMDVSAATGKDLASVSLALAKAHNGNIGALTRLGIPLDKAIIKNKDFNAALKVLTKTFTGAAKAGTETFAGKMAILGQTVNEAKESIGYAILNALQPLAEKWLPIISSGITSFVNGLTGVKDSTNSTLTPMHNFGEKVRGVFDYLKDNWHWMKLVAEYTVLFMGAMKVTSGITAFLSMGQKLINFYKTMRTVSAGAAVAEAFATEGASIPMGLLAAGAVAAGFGVAALNINWSGGGKETKAQRLRASQVGMRQVGSDAEQRQRYTELHSPASAQAGNGMVWFNGFKVFERPYMHSAKNQPLFGSHVTAPGTGKTGYRALGGAVARGASYIVGEKGPELITMGGNGFVTPNNRLGGLGGTTVVINVAGSVIHEKDLAVTVRDNIAQLMRRRGLNPAILGV